MERPGVAGVWMMIYVHRAGVDVQVSARGSQDEQTAPHSLGPELGVADLDGFARAVRRAAARGEPLGTCIEQAQALHRAVLRDGLDELRVRLGVAASGPLLVRLMISDSDLQAVPWEALAAPGEAMGFWGTSPVLLPVRGVISNEAWRPREVRGAVRVLAIAPSGGATLQPLKWALEKRIAAGEVEWLDPVEGRAARLPWLFERLRREPIPHVLHFLGHGGRIKGVPALRLADDDDGDETWLPVELLGQQIKASTRGFLRLVVLEACEGAAPSAFASAAEILARAGVDAVVAHLWPVKKDVAMVCSEQLYRTLAGANQGKGDIALSLNEARRAMLGAFNGSAEAFSPVVYLRGPDGVLFDFEDRKVGAPARKKDFRADIHSIDEARGTARLSGAQLQALHSALLDAFVDEASLARMLRFGLDRSLAEVAGSGRLGDVVFRLLEVAEAEGWTRALVDAARLANAENARLAEVARTLYG